jgi:EmrB/QacA subfamily drug resistance transporter
MSGLTDHRSPGGTVAPVPASQLSAGTDTSDEPKRPASSVEPADARSASLTMVLSSTAIFLIALEITIIAVALPEIEEAFAGVGRSTVSWVFTAYNIGVAALLLTGGWLAERFGRKRVFQSGLAIFAVGSVAAGLAPGIEVLIAARVVQSVGGALLVPASLALILHSVPPDRRDVAVGLWGAMAGVAAAVGPTLGALLVELTNWRAVFLINVPVAVLALVVGRRALVESRDPNISPRVDLVAAPAGAASVGLAVFAIIAGEPLGWTDPRVVGSLVLAALLLVAFGYRSQTHPTPVFDPSISRLPSFRVAAAGTLAFGAAFAGWLALAPTFLSEVWGYSVLRSGLAIAPGPLVMAAVAGPAGKMVTRFGHRRVIAVGALLPVLAVASWVLLVRSDSSYVTSFLPGVVLYGAGVGVGFPMLTAAALRDVPEHQYAMGAAGNTTLRQVAMAMGISMCFAIVGAASGADSAASASPYIQSWIACGVLFVATALVMLLRYPEPTDASLVGLTPVTGNDATTNQPRSEQGVQP